MGGGSFAPPLLRTEPALRAAPVFRSAYFPKKLFSFFSKTLDLQPLRGLRWAGEASLSPCSAPKCPFRTFRCFAWLIQLRQRTALSPLKRSCFRFAALTLRCRTPLSCPSRTDLSSVQKTPHLFSDGQTGCSSARTLLFPLPGWPPRDFPTTCAAQAYVSRSTASTTKRSSSPPVQVESVTILSSVPMDTSHSISEFRCAHWTSSSRSSRAAGTR